MEPTLRAWIIYTTDAQKLFLHVLALLGSIIRESSQQLQQCFRNGSSYAAQFHTHAHALKFKLKQHKPMLQLKFQYMCKCAFVTQLDFSHYHLLGLPCSVWVTCIHKCCRCQASCVMEIQLQSSNQSIRMVMTGTVQCKFSCTVTSLTIIGTGSEHVMLFVVHAFCDHLITPESFCVLCILRTLNSVLYCLVNTAEKCVTPFH